VIDAAGYRSNVGIILSNPERRVFWGRRAGQVSWQFPQGGIRRAESPEQAMYRELQEETGLLPEHVEILGCTNRWLRYRLPDKFVRRHKRPVCIGQKQIWYVLRLVGSEENFQLDCTRRPEFDFWRWVDYWYPSGAVVHFKRDVYHQALQELACFVFGDDQKAVARATADLHAMSDQGPNRRE
jgi:putative (di)nucleoside polyphosphate hydrolase